MIKFVQSSISLNEKLIGCKKSVTIKLRSFDVMLLFPLDMSIDFVLYNWRKISVFIIEFIPIIYFISVYLIFCKHIASTKLTSLFSLKFFI